ncbi:peptidoglycan DD-metalloendopeptidase family protein [Laceyella tengchongensis]|uniref:peptidoglycan DD-metalloendopeptidase family protein n=1 Tax=Laceyella tengchongensis TaxID=574699 RepID=UPI0012B99DFB|nr:peptidoglycan DD-metalloendopeptidase family protein [Laceyella tengchongensis]
MRIFSKIIYSVRRKKGASTTEFIVIMPLFFLLALVVWQLVVAGLAVLDAQAAIRDAVKVASTEGDEEKAKEQFETSFGSHQKEAIESFELEIDDQEVIAKAKIKIPIIFAEGMPDMTYNTSSKAPVLQKYVGAYSFGGGPGGSFITTGGILGPPTKSAVLTSRFGYRFHPIRHIRKLHAGIDLAGPVGTPIYAAGDGVVIRAGTSNGYGNLIIIDHGNGMQTWYAHMFPQHIYVRPGQQVKRGDHIAGIGSAGWSTGPHLHFEVHVNGQPVDPLRYISKS